MEQWILPRPKKQSPGLFLTLTSFGPVFRIPSLQQKKDKVANATLSFLVGVSGFEPEASWTRIIRMIFRCVSFRCK